jgi:protease I
MVNSLQGKKVAILVENGFEQVEMTDPRKALDDAGAQTKLVTRSKARWVENWGDRFPVDLALESADRNDFDALWLPGGVMNPDKLRMKSAGGAVRQHLC